MVLEVVERSTAARLCVEGLGLSSDAFPISSGEVYAAAIRRAASLRCPVRPLALINEVEALLADLVEEREGLKQRVQETLDALVGYGDLLEYNGRPERTIARELYLGPPGFVKRGGGGCVLIGVRPDSVPLVGEGLWRYVEYRGHTRRIGPRPGEDLAALLADYGLVEIPEDWWLRAPRPASAAAYPAVYDAKLVAAGGCDDVPGVRILDVSRPIDYYVGRWRVPEPRDNGRFVARRPQEFGSHLWCYAALSGGRVVGLIDLPLDPDMGRGCDEAWRLAAAKDSLAGHPQRLTMRPAGGDDHRVVFEVQTPLPRWLQRRWDLFGAVLERGRSSSLLAYEMDANEVEQEMKFAAQSLWLQVDEVPSGGVRGDG